MRTCDKEKLRLLQRDKGELLCPLYLPLSRQRNAKIRQEDVQLISPDEQPSRGDLRNTSVSYSVQQEDDTFFWPGLGKGSLQMRREQLNIIIEKNPLWLGILPQDIVMQEINLLLHNHGAEDRGEGLLGQGCWVTVWCVGGRSHHQGAFQPDHDIGIGIDWPRKRRSARAA